MARNGEEVDVRGDVVDMLIEKIASDRNPSVTMMNLVEELLAPDDVTAYAEVLMDLVIERVASMPSKRGIRMSIKAMSGRNRRASATAVTPSAASPTTSMSGSASSNTESAHQLLVVGDQDPDAHRRSKGRIAWTANPPSGRGPVSSLPSKTATRFTHPRQPSAVGCRSLGRRALRRRVLDGHVQRGL